MHVMPFRDPNSKPEVKEATGTIKPELAGKTRESQASKKGDRERGKGGIRGQGKIWDDGKSITTTTASLFGNRICVYSRVCVRASDAISFYVCLFTLIGRSGVISRTRNIFRCDAFMI